MALLSLRMHTFTIRDGSFSEIHPLESGLSFDVFNIPLNASWTPRWSKDPSVLFSRSVEEGTLANVYGGNGFMTSDSILSPPDHWNDPHPAIKDIAISAPPISQVPTPTSLKESSRLSRPTTAEDKNRKRKRHLIEGESERNLKSRRGTHSSHSSEPSDEQDDGNDLLIKARNRIASNKFRNKKKEDTIRLESEKQELERINSTLSIRVASLAREVYELKSKLLQHSDCGCTLIQDYITNTANEYTRKFSNTAVKGVTA